MTDYALRLTESEVARYGRMAELAARVEGARWAAAGVVPGATVADVGCGPGAVSVLLAGLVGPEGRVLAIDREPSTIATAKDGAARAGVANIDFRVGPADDTGVSANSVDTVMIRHVLAHNGGREPAIVAHAASLVRPGGSVFLVDVEVTALRSRPSDPDVDDLTQRYVQWHRNRGNDLSVGLRLAELVAGAGLEVIDFVGSYMISPVPPGMRPPSWAAVDTLVAEGLATAEDVERWRAAFERVDRQVPLPTSFVPQFSATGRRPAAEG